MYVCIFACMHVCMYACMMDGWMHESMYGAIDECMFIYIHVYPSSHVV